jgi:hypothetical protein
MYIMIPPRLDRHALITSLVACAVNAGTSICTYIFGVVPVHKRAHTRLFVDGCCEEFGCQPWAARGWVYVSHSPHSSEIYTLTIGQF